MKTFKKITIAILCIAMLPLAAQKKQKIKGNKEVVEVFRNLDGFNEIIGIIRLKYT